MLTDEENGRRSAVIVTTTPATRAEAPSSTRRPINARSGEAGTPKTIDLGSFFVIIESS
jgi:hypothetical protein